MLFHSASFPLPNFPKAFNDSYREPESQAVEKMLKNLVWTADQAQQVHHRAQSLVEGVRAQKVSSLSLSGFLKSYDLTSKEGVVLMTLAEALLRTPDGKTQLKLIEDRLSLVEWSQQASKSDLFSIKMAHLGLEAARKLLSIGKGSDGLLSSLLGTSRAISEPIIRQSVSSAMEALGNQFVLGETISEALKNSQSNCTKGYRHSFDMLGEEAYTREDTTRYFEAYSDAIQAIGKAALGSERPLHKRPAISIKLSALHPRYEVAQRDDVLSHLTASLEELAVLAANHQMALTIDAEEASRLALSLEVIEKVFQSKRLGDWEGFGFAVQAYQKRCSHVIDWAVELSKKHHRRLSIRLVKGAYWDTEIKIAQQEGMEDYPVFTRKEHTDLSYLYCAQKLLEENDRIFPQFASHNAHTISAIIEMAGQGKKYELQRLQGMGEALYDQVMKTSGYHGQCCIYAPVGPHKELLPYLVRRLLENGANSSFVHQILDKSISADDIISDPIQKIRESDKGLHPKIPLPADILKGKEPIARLNSKGLDLSDYSTIQVLDEKMKKGLPTMTRLVKDGHSDQEILTMIENSKKAEKSWSKLPVEKRATLVKKLSDLLESHQEELLLILAEEGGKTLPDGIAEVREAIDFCRYYANQALEKMTMAVLLPGPTGEKNELTLHPRGTFLCISPWNFPLAIFLGQAAAALVTGNCVIAKPAAQTPKIACRVQELAYEAGIPKDVFQIVLTSGRKVSDLLVADDRVNGVTFTGSTATAQTINQVLSARKGPVVPLIAETGGMNAMIVDSSALLQQVVNDVLSSAFQSAGQRCSALRALFLQEEIADHFLDILKGAMAELKVGDPKLLSTDVGPVIDQAQKEALLKHVSQLKESSARLIYECPLSDDLKEKLFVAPQAWELGHSSDLKEEVFGPILHVFRYPSSHLDKMIEAINQWGYGLTLGVHSRIDQTIRSVRENAKVGNLYINRNMIGAVVGVQPFGGEGFSGTGLKAGGPHYLYRFLTERTYSQDTTAVGGNASLFMEIG